MLADDGPEIIGERYGKAKHAGRYVASLAGKQLDQDLAEQAGVAADGEGRPHCREELGGEEGEEIGKEHRVERAEEIELQGDRRDVVRQADESGRQLGDAERYADHGGAEDRP